MQNKRRLFTAALLALMIVLAANAPLPAVLAQADDPTPPEQPLKLVFIHHSTGENWLADGYGNLGRELDRNNYFVSDTNYGWGPDAIGDRTDIPNWLEWFRGSRTPDIMQALFNESGQHASYTRTLGDPGGENQIIMFKSCFPNSALTGRPNDPAGTYEELSVSGAKYVYNQLLAFFSTRPDKLFIVITAPPLNDPQYADNARAFNRWLVNDWLAENNYTLGNVAVFDFYNILTGADAHHRYHSSKIEHTLGSRNTLYYPSGDDHPSQQGSQKATEEFIPLLNIFYNRWKANAPYQAPLAVEGAESGGSEPEAGAPSVSQVQPLTDLLIDDFEGGAPIGTDGWQAYRDEETTTSMRCQSDTGTAASGSRALMLDFDVVANSWATCALSYHNVQDWSSSEGLTFHLFASQPGLLFNVDIYAGSREAQETYLYTIESPPEGAAGWIPFSLRWSDFHRADWEENAGTSFTKPDEILGLAFGLATLQDAPNTGTLWIDDLSLIGLATTPAGEVPAQNGLTSEADDNAERPARRLLPCGTEMALPMAFICGAVWFRRKNP